MRVNSIITINDDSFEEPPVLTYSQLRNGSYFKFIIAGGVWQNMLLKKASTTNTDFNYLFFSATSSAYWSCKTRNQILDYRVVLYDVNISATKATS